MAEVKGGIEFAEAELRLEKAPAAFTPLEALPLEELATAAALHGAIQRYMKKKGQAVVWSYAWVRWGRWDGEQVSLALGEADPREILEIRVFNREEELRLVRESDCFAGRYVADGAGEEHYHVDSFSRLWGERDLQGEVPHGYVRLVDHARKLEMDVPFEGQAEGLKYLGLETRNYVMSDEATGLSGYGDYRYVAIEPAQGGKWNG